MITNQIGFPVGCLKMSRILYWIRASGGRTGEEIYAKYIEVFDQYFQDTVNFPKGTERLHWEKNSLMKVDKELCMVDQKYRERVLGICFDIVAQFDKSEENDHVH